MLSQRSTDSHNTACCLSSSARIMDVQLFVDSEVKVDTCAFPLFQSPGIVGTDMAVPWYGAMRGLL